MIGDACMESTKNKRYYWLKLKEDFFNRKEIKKLRKLAGGDTFVIIYLKMLLISINNDGIIRFDGVENSLEDELALQLDEGSDNVKMTVLYLKSQGLLEQVDVNGSEYSLPEAIKNVGSEAESTERVRRMRERKKMLSIEQQKEKELNNKDTKKLSTPLQCNANVTADNDFEAVDNLPLQCNENVTQEPKPLQCNKNSSQCNGESLQSNDSLQCNAHVTQCNESVTLEKDRDIYINNTNTPYSTTVVSSTSEAVDNFQTFAKEYPKKISNFEFAKKQWNYLIQSAVPATDILDAVRKYKNKILLERIETKYVKNPENFLRDGTWIDYLPQALNGCSVCDGKGYEYITDCETPYMQPCKCTHRADFYRQLYQQHERRAQ